MVLLLLLALLGAVQLHCLLGAQLPQMLHQPPIPPYINGHGAVPLSPALLNTFPQTHQLEEDAGKPL